MGCQGRRRTDRGDRAQRLCQSGEQLARLPRHFRGVLDVRARTITDEMAIAAAGALAQLGREQGLTEERILPGMGDIEVAARVAAATGAKAQAQDVARKQVGPDRLYQDTLAVIRAAREATRLLIEAEIIPPDPDRSGAQ